MSGHEWNLFMVLDELVKRASSRGPKDNADRVPSLQRHQVDRDRLHVLMVTPDAQAVACSAPDASISPLSKRERCFSSPTMPYAEAISLKRVSAALSPGFKSGWFFFGQPTVGLADFVLRRLTADAQDLIWVRH